MAEFDGKFQFIKSALSRLKDAEELLEPPSRQPFVSDAGKRHLRSAMYLAGYSVECILKAYIITKVSNVETLSAAIQQRRKSGEIIADIQGSAGHNLITLLLLTDLDIQIRTDKGAAKDWAICLKWSSSWRYDPSEPEREQAEAFVSAVRRFHHWVKNSFVTGAEGENLMTTKFASPDTAIKAEASLHQHFPNAGIELRPGYQGRIHIIIASPSFNGLKEEEKQEMVWDFLRADLKEEAQNITLVIPYSMDELYG